MVLRDYHLHTEYSFDSQASMRAHADKAISQGIEEIVFTDHFDPFATEEETPLYDAEGYFKEIREVQAEYEGKIIIKTGVEVGQSHLYPERVKKVIESHPYDFVIGSVHCVTGDKDLAFQSYTMANAHSWLYQYFMEACEVAKIGDYDVFGHLNYICRYMQKQKIPVKVRDYEEMAMLVLRQIAANGKGMEINVSTLRGQGTTPLPPIELVKKFRSLGGEIITVGSDSHTPQNVASSLKRGIEIAKRAGFKYIATFSERKPTFHKI